MDVKSYKNSYGHEVVNCPFCKDFGRVHWVYLRDSNKVSPDPLRDLKRHITTEAKNEAFVFALAGADPKPVITPHLEYLKEHSSILPVAIKNKRHYDNDLKLI